MSANFRFTLQKYKNICKYAKKIVILRRICKKRIKGKRAMRKENKEENEPKTYIDREKYRKNTFREL